jgi:ketosteroid isomerase-like protein
VALSNGDAVSALFEAYLAQNRAEADRLLSDDVVFTSPQDDHIDKTAYFERCFPTAHRLSSQKILNLVAADEQSVFLLYEYALTTTGERHRNVEFINVRDGQIAEIQVFFGGQVRA